MCAATWLQTRVTRHLLRKDCKSKLLLMPKLKHKLFAFQQRTQPSGKQQGSHKNTKTQADVQKVKAQPRHTQKIPYHYADRILLVGEGNFSFSAALKRHLTRQLNSDYTADEYEERKPGCLVATAYDTREMTLEKYPDVETIISAVESIEPHVDDVEKLDQIARDLYEVVPAVVLFNIDAMKLHIKPFISHLPLHARFDKVVFNFPHVGLGIKDQDHNIHANQQLILNFLQSCRDVLSLSASKPGQVHVTIKNGMPYELWDVKNLAKMAGYKTLTSFAFDPSVYPGYEHRRTLGFKDGVSQDANAEILKHGSRTFIFVPDVVSPSQSLGGCHKRKRTKKSESDDEER